VRAARAEEAAAAERERPALHAEWGQQAAAARATEAARRAALLRLREDVEDFNRRACGW